MDDHFGSLRRRRFRFPTLLVVTCGVSLVLFVPAAVAGSPVGLWYAEGGAAEVQIVPCSNALCGKVVWLHSPLGEDGCELIYDPTSGRTYSCNARMEGDDRLFLRGYFGIKLLGRTTTWTRVGTGERRCQR